MRPRKGQKKLFDSGIIIAILQEKNCTLAGTKELMYVTACDVATVNEHLFPRSGVCFGILVSAIAVAKSKPEIKRQLRKQLKGVDVMKTSQSSLKKILGDEVALVCTGK